MASAAAAPADAPSVLREIVESRGTEERLLPSTSGVRESEAPEGSRLPAVPTVESEALTGAGSLETCFICLEDLERSSWTPLSQVRRSTAATAAVQLPCPGAHTYHKDCIVKWLRAKRNCPMCREDISREGDGTVPHWAHDERFFDAEGRFHRTPMNMMLLPQAACVTIQCCLFGSFDGVWQACFVKMGNICGALCTQVGDGLTSLVAGCAGATVAADSHKSASAGSHAGAAASTKGTAVGGSASSHAALPAHACAAAVPHACLCGAGGLCIAGLLALAVGDDTQARRRRVRSAQLSASES
ncbi:unnamed protein product [Polarella glacialis]|uniref:RING-type domain-containing protein n=1 Tax=Polarella glacialis TaxID=89957 RepID=A0A813JBS0_POLGL|nr:unnamed protein product [Polarella glacialis]